MASKRPPKVGGPPADNTMDSVERQYRRFDFAVTEDMDHGFMAVP